jgi:hypothetical protein
MKIVAIFLISFALLIFSNTASASFFSDMFRVFFGDIEKPSEIIENHGSVDNVRCKVEYTQLDLATGLEKTIKHTDQYNIVDIAIGEDVMYLSAQDLTDKINIWLNENKNNVIADLTIINCKERRVHTSKFSLVPMFKYEYRWSEYKGCADEFNIKLIDFLDRPKQWGYNVHKERLIKDYKGGCKNYVKTSQLNRQR